MIIIKFKDRTIELDDEWEDMIERELCDYGIPFKEIN